MATLIVTDTVVWFRLQTFVLWKFKRPYYFGRLTIFDELIKIQCLDLTSSFIFFSIPSQAAMLIFMDPITSGIIVVDGAVIKIVYNLYIDICRMKNPILLLFLIILFKKKSTCNGLVRNLSSNIIFGVNFSFLYSNQFSSESLRSMV